MEKPTYRGIPLDGLRIESVEWTDEQAEHIRTRSARKGTAEFDVELEWASEAVFDPDRIVGLPGSGQSIKVIGYSETAGRLLKVWLYPRNLQAGEWFGASACSANMTDQRNYKGAMG